MPPTPTDRDFTILMAHPFALVRFTTYSVCFLYENKNRASNKMQRIVTAHSLRLGKRVTRSEYGSTNRSSVKAAHNVQYVLLTSERTVKCSSFFEAATNSLYATNWTNVMLLRSGSITSEPNRLTTRPTK